MTQAVSKTKSGEKKKWQLALRRYLLEANRSEQYAPYFGLDIVRFRQWVELQFTHAVSWTNFGESWQLAFIIPVSFFDFDSPEDLGLCWNFTNVRVEILRKEADIGDDAVDLFAAKRYFQDIYAQSGYSIAGKMVEKIGRLEEKGKKIAPVLLDFIKDNHGDLENLVSFNAEDLSLLNKGRAMQDILLEKEILRKFG